VIIDEGEKFNVDFDSGKDVTAIVDISRVRCPLRKQKRLM